MSVRDEHLAITIQSEDVVYQRFRKVIEYRYTEDAEQISAKREIITGQHAVAVVAFDPKLQKLVMIRQFRLGAQLGTGRGMTAEIVAGLIDPGEDPLTTAKRELFEETGLVAKRVEPLCEFLTTPGMTDEVIHLFYAEVDASELPARAGVETETEQTFPFLLTLDEALAAIDENAIYNGIVMVGLLWFARHQARLTGQKT